MIMCVPLCYPLSLHMSQLLSTGRPISSFIQVAPFTAEQISNADLFCIIQFYICNYSEVVSFYQQTERHYYIV